MRMPAAHEEKVLSHVLDMRQSAQEGKREMLGEANGADKKSPRKNAGLQPEPLRPSKTIRACERGRVGPKIAA
jgi:hypothetical protein